MIAAVDSVCFCQLVVFIIMETILKLNYTNKVGGCSTHVQMDVSYLLAAAVSLSVHRYMLYLLLPVLASRVSRAAALSHKSAKATD